QRLSGLVLGGNPGLTAQEDAGVFGPNMGYLANRPTLAAQKQAGDLASSLLGDATKLQGPENYATYDRFIGGGRSLLDQLYGGPRASTGTTGDNQPNTLQTLMARLGLTGPLTSPRADMGPGVDATGTHPVPVTNMANLLFPNLGVDPNQTNAVQGVGGGGNNPDDNIGGMGSGVLSDVDPTQFIDPLTGGL